MGVGVGVAVSVGVGVGVGVLVGVGVGVSVAVGVGVTVGVDVIVAVGVGVTVGVGVGVAVTARNVLVVRSRTLFITRCTGVTDPGTCECMIWLTTNANSEHTGLAWDSAYVYSSPETLMSSCDLVSRFTHESAASLRPKIFHDRGFLEGRPGVPNV